MKLIAFLLLVSCQKLCIAREVSDDGSYRGLEKQICCQCFKQYNDLDQYILNNKEVVRNLTEAFFKTGRNPSRFVKITYHFQSCEQMSKNQLNDIVDNEIISCTSLETTYVWSESILYLFGPKPLLWLTLFTVITPEASVTIELPCLCRNEEFYLTDRLTYLVSL